MRYLTWLRAALIVVPVLPMVGLVSPNFAKQITVVLSTVIELIVLLGIS